MIATAKDEVAHNSSGQGESHREGLARGRLGVIADAACRANHRVDEGDGAQHDAIEPPQEEITALAVCNHAGSKPQQHSENQKKRRHVFLMYSVVSRLGPMKSLQPIDASRGVRIPN